MNEEILNRLASLETRVSNLEVKLMDTNKSNPGLLHEEVVKFLQTFGSELNRMYGAYGPNQMAMNIQPRFMYQPPMYNPMSGFNPSVHSTNYAMKPNGFENYPMDTNNGLVQPTFTPFYGTGDTYQQTENIDNEAQVQHEKLNNTKKVKNTVYIPAGVWSINRKDWVDRLKELNIDATITNSADRTLADMNPEAYHGMIVYNTEYPDRGLKESYAWYPVKLIDSNTHRYAWTIVKLV